MMKTIIRLENTFGNRVWFGWIEGDMARARSTMPQTKGNFYNMI